MCMYAKLIHLLSVVRSAIGEIPLCIAGEVDCVKGEDKHCHYCGQ